MLADAMTKNSTKALMLMEYFLKRGTWRLVHDDDFVSARNRKKKGLGILDTSATDWDHVEIRPELTEADDDGRAEFENLGNGDIKAMIKTAV